MACENSHWVCNLYYTNAHDTKFNTPNQWRWTRIWWVRPVTGLQRTTDSLPSAEIHSLSNMVSADFPVWVHRERTFAENDFNQLWVPSGIVLHGGILTTHWTRCKLEGIVLLPSPEHSGIPYKGGSSCSCAMGWHTSKRPSGKEPCINSESWVWDENIKLWTVCVHVRGGGT